jgi:hypothetical protein
MASEIDELSTELVHGLDPWTPVDAAFIRWLWLPTWKRWLYWVLR